MIDVDALLFDLDGTLIDSKGDLTACVQWLQRRYKVRESSEAQVASYIGNGVGRLVSDALGNPSPKILIEAVEAYKTYYKSHCLDSTAFYSNVAETIFHFRHKKLAVVTNKPIRVTRHILESLGVAPFFKSVIGGDSLRLKKPHPAPIQHALSELGVRPRRAVMVGDGPNDILSGTAAGTRTCLLHSNITRPKDLALLEPDIEIWDFGELRHLFFS